MATNLIQIKRSDTTATPTSLANGELAWSGVSNALFIGSNSSVVPIAGLRVPGTLTANQALVANATSGIDRIITANAIVTTLTANGTTGTAGQILTSNGTASHWANPANSSFTIAGDTGSDVVSTGQTLSFLAANGLTTAVTDNQVAFSVDTGPGIVANTQGIQVVAGVGITSNNTGVHVNAGTNGGLVSNSTGVFVNVGSSLLSNATGLYVNVGHQFAWTNTQTFAANVTWTGNTSRPDIIIGPRVGIYVGNTSTPLGEGGMLWFRSEDYDSRLNSAGLSVKSFPNTDFNGVNITDTGITVGNTSGLGKSSSMSAYSVQSERLVIGNQPNSTFTANTTRVVIGSAQALQANGGIGTAGQVLHSDGTTIYWDADDQGVTSVTAGNGLSGGTITSTGTIAVVAGNTTVVSNATGVYVNAAAVSIATSQLTGDVALGTGTSGNYVATITAGAGISGSSSTEGGTPTIAVVAGTNGGLVSNATGVWVSTGSGLLSNSTGVHVGTANGITVTADAVGVLTGSTLTVNATGVHVNSTLSITDLTLAGNLTVSGTLTTIDTLNLTVKDSMIELANGNVSTDAIDIGFYGQYGESGAKFTGMFRDASDGGIYKLYTGLLAEPLTTVDTANTSYTQGTFQAFLRSGGLVSNSTAVTITANSTVAVNLTANSLTLTTPLAATSGGTGLNTYTVGDIIVASNTTAFSKLALAAEGRILMSNGTALVYDTLDGGTF